jgi:hypothetical protein
MNILVTKCGRHIWPRLAPDFSYIRRNLIWKFQRRRVVHHTQEHGPDIKRTRNIGIIAHIDAVRVCLYLPVMEWPDNILGQDYYF